MEKTIANRSSPEDVKDEFSKRSILTSNEIFSSYTRQKPERITAYQLINRLLILIQQPTIFLFYKKNNDDRSGTGLSGLELILYTQKDIFFWKTFRDEILEEFHESVDGGQSYFLRKDLENDIKPVEIPFEADSYYYLLVKVDRDSKNQVSFQLYDKEDKKYELFSKLWNSLIFGKYSKKLGIPENIKKSIEEFRFFKSVPQNSLVTHSLNVEHKEKLKVYLEEIDELVNEIYLDFSESCIVAQQGKVPSNILFFQRFYYEDSNFERNPNPIIETKGYPYSLRLVLCKKQTEEVKQAFHNLFLYSDLNRFCESGDGCDEFVYRDGDIESAVEEVNQHFYECGKEEFTQASRQYFFSLAMLYSNTDEDGRKLILNGIVKVLSSHYGKDSRAVADSSIASGLAHYRKRMFKHASNDRLSHRLIENFLNLSDEGLNIIDFEDEDLNEVKKVVFLHYLLCAQSPQSNVDALGGVFFPVQIGGTTYMTIMRSFINRDGEVDDEEWKSNFHFYDSIVRQFVKKFRREGWGTYQNRVKSIFSSYVVEMLKGGGGNNQFTNADVVDFNRRLLIDLELLTRVWPFPRIDIKFERKPAGTGFSWFNDKVCFSKEVDFAFSVQVQENMFFQPNNKKVPSINEEELVKDLDALANRVLRDVYFESQFSSGLIHDGSSN